MISESIKKKLDTLKSPENSQTNQSGFSASGMDKLTALKEELKKPVTPYEPKFDESLVESGKTKYESDKSQFQSAYGKWNRNVMGVASANWGKTGKAVEGLPDNRTGWEGVSDRYTADMDEDTLKSFYTLYDKDADSAIDFASEYQRLKAEQKAVENAVGYENALKNLGLVREENPEVANEIIGGLAKTGTGIAAMAFTPIDAASALIDYSAGGGNFSEDVKVGNAMPFTQMSSQYQNEVRQAIAQDAKWAETKEGGFFREKLGIENFATAMFDVGYSSAQSALIMKTFGPAGLALFGTSAFSSSLQENLARDENGEPLMDDGTALAKATIAGALEVITEEVSLEYVLKAKDSKGVFTKIRNLIFAGLAEGSEELASEVGNYVTDALLRADESDFAKAKAMHLATDANGDDAKAGALALLDFIPDAAYATLSGFFSGLLMQGFAMSIQDVVANANARSTIAESKASGEYADLIEGLNASDYMKGQKPLTESSKKRDVVKAYRGATESIEQASIKDRLMEETTYAFEGEAEATAKAIYDKANDYALSAAQKRLLGSQTAQKVLTEYTEGKAKSGTHEWVDRAVLSQQYATRSTKGESMFSETELGRELRESEKSKAELSARESALKVVSEQIGIDVKTLASQNINMPVETYENNLELAYSYGRAGYKLEDVARKLGTDVSGIFGEAYQKGLEAYKSRSTEKSLRTKLGGKVNIVSQSELDKLNTRAIKETGQNPNYTEVNLSEMKKNNPMVYSAMEMVAKVYAPSIGRQVNFFSAENGVNGWRDASGIWINTDGVFEEYGKKGNVLGFFVHEFGHDLRADAPELFEEARQIIIDSAYKGNADALTKAAEGIILERGGDTKVDLEGAVEELVCDGLVKLTEDKEMLDKAFRTENLNFWKRFKNFLDKLVENFKKFLNTFTGANETARLLDVDAVQKLADVVGKYVDRIQAETKSSKSTETSTENKSETKQSITHKAITYEEVKKARDDYNDARIAYSKLEADYNDKVRKIMSNGKSTDEQISEIVAEEKRLGVDEAKKALDETRKKYETTEKAYAEQQLKIEKEKERAAIEKSGLSEADYFRKLAKKEFGITGNFRIAGYMLPSGSMLNFGAGSTTIRGEDHRRIGTIYTSDVTAEIASAGMLKFMNDGNIRVMAETPGVDISSKVEPTAQQYANIKRMAASLGKEEGYFSVDFTDTESKYGDVVGVLEYDNNINPERIVNDIKHYYATGEVRVPSTVGKFYSVPHTDAAPTFYSQMGKVIEQQKANKFDARSLINMLLGNGVKAEEIKWSGIATFLEGKKSVTKEELVDFVNKSKLQIEETWLGNGEWNESPELFEATRENVRQSALENLQNQFEIGMLKNLSEAINTLRIDYENGAFMATAELDGNEITFFKENPRINVARWGDREYNLSPYNYRELLFRLPGATYTNKAMKVHWGAKASGILAHARIDDAWLNNPPTDPDTGEAYPMLFIEEIQSDWDNARHKREMARKLYRQLTDLMTEAKQNPGFEKADKRFESIKKKLENYMGFYIYADDGYLLDNDIVPYRLESSYDVILESDNEADIYDAIRAVIEMDIVGTGDIPDAPYGDGKYVEYTLKKLLRTAAEEGYTKIGWTTGKQQEERWSDEYAEAYRIEYDQQMPKFLNKYGKQWGATVSQEELSNGQTVWTFPINEAMRKSLIYDGLPMYSVKHIDTKTTIKSGSLFSGGGLLEQGLEYQLLTHEFGVEYDASIAATWRENNGDGKIYAGKAEGNVFNFDGKQYKGKMFHIHASPVCHNLSPAKHGYGEQPSDIESAKKTLQIFLDAEAPVYTVENAELYAKTESARIIKEGLEKAGYIVDIGVYNSADYGSAQSRTRTIIRAVRGDLMMPDRARKIPRTRTWDQVTSDLWDGLERITEKEVPDFYLKAVKNTGIDINNVKVPTLLLQTTTGGKMTYAVEGSQSPTLTTHCYEAKLLLPGGVICNVTPQFMGRLMGLPDDFKYPHWKNGDLKKTIPYKIIGNGIPVELTKAVVGGVIESAYKQTMGTELYSIKHIDEFSLSPRQYLAAAALETIRDPADREELRKIIDEYQTLDDTKTDLERQISELLVKQDELNADLQEIQQTLTKTSAAKSRIVTDLINRYGSTREAMSSIRTELKDIEKQLKNLRSEQGKVTARLHDILTMPRVESIIEEQRQLVREYRNLYQSTKEADKIKLQELRERMNQKLRAEIDKRIEMRKKMVADYNERKKIDYYMPRIEATLKDLDKHLAKAPMPFRGPVLQFISMLDFRQRDKEGNVRLTRKSGNEVVPHQANLERERRLAEIEELLGKDEASYGDIENWFKAYGIELDEDLKTYITGVRNFLKNFVAANMVPVNMRAEDAAEIKSVYQFAKMLDRLLVIAAKGYTDAALDQSKNSREIAEHIEPLERKNTKVSRLESFMSVDNAQPETIFDRLGEGGKKLFNILASGADRYAINRQIISDFAADWDKKQVREWQNPKELVSVPFTTVDDEGNETVENVPMTPAQMMTLYATLQDPDGWRHIIDGEGFQLDRIKIGADGKKGEQVDTTRKMTEKDYNALVEKMNAYDPNLIPFADKLHKFISDQGREWGNQVSIGRYGFEQFTQPKYFPLFTVEKGKSNTIDAIYSAMRRSFYGLLNRSFTKERLPNAVNALIIGDFFDIFIEHMSDMALYNAYALPVLEVNRFLNYVEYDVEKDEKGNEHLVEQWKMKDKLDKAFGTDIIENYIKNVFDSINGQEYLSRSDSLFLMGLKLRNRVAVTANVRVIVQQFFSIIRAGEVIPSKYLLKGGYNFKETRDEMYRYAPVALWKKQGNYNTDIKLPLKEELIGAETGYKRFVNAVSEYGMTPAEFMDEVAWTRIWHGVTEWVKDTNPGLSGEAFYDECNKRFRDIIYRTQVVDSVLQKSQFMRQQTFQARVLSSFKGEPTTSYNQLLRVVDMYKDAKQRGDLKTAWATIRPLALRAIAAYCLNAIANAVVTSLVDMIRDDDDYETMWEKFIEALLGEYRKNTRFWRDNMTFGERVGAFTRWFQSLLRSNLVESFNPFDIPLLSDIFSLLQGYDADRADLMIAEQAFDLMGGIIKSVDGMDTKLVYDLVGAVSQLFGLPVQNVMRDSLATWNSVVGIWNELFGTTLNMKVQITPESAQSGYEALYDAMSKGKESRALELVTEIMDNVKDSDKAYNGITTQIRDAYKHNEITAEQAHDYLIAAYSYFDVHKKSFDTPAKLDKHIKDQVSGWDK